MKGLAAIVCTLSCIAALAQSGKEPAQIKGLENLPEASGGNIDGKPAILIWPFDVSHMEALDLPEGCQITIEPHDTAEFKYLTFPCGKWFVPPIGRYDLWLDSPTLVSEHTMVFAFGGGKFQGFGSRSLHAVVPGGNIRFAGAKIPAGSESFRVLSLRDAWIPYERVLAPKQAWNGVNVPAGRVLAGFFSAAGDAVALSRPVPVTIAGRAVFTLSKPAVGGDILLVINKVGPSEMSPRAGLQVVARSGEMSFPPDVLLDSRDDLVAVWYGRAERRIQISAPPLMPEERTVLITPGQVTTLRESVETLSRQNHQSH